MVEHIGDWNNGTEFGQPSTYEIKWKILPIYIVKPALNYVDSPVKGELVCKLVYFARQILPCVVAVGKHKGCHRVVRGDAAA